MAGLSYNYDFSDVNTQEDPVPLLAANPIALTAAVAPLNLRPSVQRPSNRSSEGRPVHHRPSGSLPLSKLPAAAGSSPPSKRAKPTTAVASPRTVAWDEEEVLGSSLAEPSLTETANPVSITAAPALVRPSTTPSPRPANPVPTVPLVQKSPLPLSPSRRPSSATKMPSPLRRVLDVSPGVADRSTQYLLSSTSSIPLSFFDDFTLHDSLAFLGQATNPHGEASFYQPLAETVSPTKVSAQNSGSSLEYDLAQLPVGYVSPTSVSAQNNVASLDYDLAQLPLGYVSPIASPSGHVSPMASPGGPVSPMASPPAHAPLPPAWPHDAVVNGRRRPAPTAPLTETDLVSYKNSMRAKTGPVVVPVFSPDTLPFRHIKLDGYAPDAWSDVVGQMRTWMAESQLTPVGRVPADWTVEQCRAVLNFWMQAAVTEARPMQDDIITAWGDPLFFDFKRFQLFSNGEVGFMSELQNMFSKFFTADERKYQQSRVYRTASDIMELLVDEWLKRSQALATNPVTWTLYVRHQTECLLVNLLMASVAASLHYQAIEQRIDRYKCLPFAIPANTKKFQYQRTNAGTQCRFCSEDPALFANLTTLMTTTTELGLVFDKQPKNSIGKANAHLSAHFHVPSGICPDMQCAKPAPRATYLLHLAAGGTDEEGGFYRHKQCTAKTTEAISDDRSNDPLTLKAAATYFQFYLNEKLRPLDRTANNTAVKKGIQHREQAKEEQLEQLAGLEWPPPEQLDAPVAPAATDNQKNKMPAATWTRTLCWYCLVTYTVDAGVEHNCQAR